MEAEFVNMVKDKQTKFDMLKCRLAGAQCHVPAAANTALLLAILVAVRVRALAVRPERSKSRQV